jgi:hypothetical protein
MGLLTFIRYFLSVMTKVSTSGYINQRVHEGYKLELSWRSLFALLLIEFDVHMTTNFLQR